MGMAIVTEDRSKSDRGPRYYIKSPSPMKAALAELAKRSVDAKRPKPAPVDPRTVGAPKL